MDLRQLAVFVAAIIVPGAALALYWRQILEAIENLGGGGPRTPSHPLPGNDGVIVLRKRRRDLL